MEPERYQSVAIQQNGRIAQLVEQRIENPRVGGSIPPSATIFHFILNIYYLLQVMCNMHRIEPPVVKLFGASLHLPLRVRYRS